MFPIPYLAPDLDLAWTSPFTESVEGFADPRFQTKPLHQIFKPFCGKNPIFELNFNINNPQMLR